MLFRSPHCPAVTQTNLPGRAIITECICSWRSITKPSRKSARHIEENLRHNCILFRLTAVPTVCLFVHLSTVCVCVLSIPFLSLLWMLTGARFRFILLIQEEGSGVLLGRTNCGLCTEKKSLIKIIYQTKTMGYFVFYRAAGEFVCCMLSD